MKKMMMALALCLMSAIGFAQNRQMTTALPANTPSVALTLGGKLHTVKPTKAAVKEADDSHVDCVVYAGRDKAEVTLPISFDTILDICLRGAQIARDLNLITEEQWETAQKEYQRLAR